MKVFFDLSGDRNVIFCGIMIVTDRERRKVIGNIFADAAKYTLTAGVITSFLAGKYSLLSSIMLGISFVVFALLAYFITPKDEKGG
jgi:putative Ca2+/H+ antiporter (TMEM165/GDT1 family)